MTEEATVREIKPDAPLFTKDELLKMERPEEVYVVPGYAKSVRLQALNAHEQSQYQGSMIEMSTDEKGKPHTTMKMEGHNIRLVVKGMRDPKMNEYEVGQLPNDFVKAVADRLRTISGMDTTVEDAEGN